MEALFVFVVCMLVGFLFSCSCRIGSCSLLLLRLNADCCFLGSGLLMVCA